VALRYTPFTFRLLQFHMSVFEFAAGGKKVGIVGCTGAVGIEMMTCLHKRAFPMSELVLFASARSAGKVLSTPFGELTVRLFSQEAAREMDIVLMAVSGDFAKEHGPAIAAEGGAVVIDNSSAWRMDPNVPLVIPEINGEPVSQSVKKEVGQWEPEWEPEWEPATRSRTARVLVRWPAAGSWPRRAHCCPYLHPPPFTNPPIYQPPLRPPSTPPTPPPDGPRALAASAIGDARLIANPNCTTAIAAMALWPLHQKFTVRGTLRHIRLTSSAYCFRLVC
jgi:hypothetical protein